MSTPPQDTSQKGSRVKGSHEHAKQIQHIPMTTPAPAAQCAHGGPQVFAKHQSTKPLALLYSNAAAVHEASCLMQQACAAQQAGQASKHNGPKHASQYNIQDRTAQLAAENSHVQMRGENWKKGEAAPYTHHCVNTQLPIMCQHNENHVSTQGSGARHTPHTQKPKPARVVEAAQPAKLVGEVAPYTGAW